MEEPSPSIRHLAHQLVAARKRGSDPLRDETIRVYDALRSSLSRLAGNEGYGSLLRRAVILAADEVPALAGATIGTQGRLLLVNATSGDKHSASRAAKGFDSRAATAITAHLFGLLVTLVGETFVLRLVRDAWPDVSLLEQKPQPETDS